jgi:hypothetical protein
MSYDDKFYQRYEAYLQEQVVREAHDWVFQVARLNPAFQNVVDFGCGRSREFRLFTRHLSYIGIDLDETARVRLDYRTMDLDQIPSDTTAFVSLFSSEITAPPMENELFYRRIFRDLPNIQAGLVAGFYYADQKNTNPVVETGGVVSYQTLEPMEAHVESLRFTERRIMMHVPSEMFGEHVYEVWRFFERRPLSG